MSLPSYAFYELDRLGLNDAQYRKIVELFLAIEDWVSQETEETVRSEIETAEFHRDRSTVQ